MTIYDDFPSNSESISLGELYFWKFYILSSDVTKSDDRIILCDDNHIIYCAI